MSEEATRQQDLPAAGRKRSKAWRWALPAAFLVILTIALLIGSATAPYLFTGATLGGEIAEQVRATTGLKLTAGVPGRFDLLPRPHVVIHALHVSDPSETLMIDAEKLEGEVRLLPLIVGRIELSSLTLSKPRLVIDLDGKPMRSDSLIGRAMHAEPAAGGEHRLGSVTLNDGTAVIKGSAFHRVPDIEQVNVTLDWRDIGSAATLTGTMSLRQTAVDVSAWIAQPASLMRGDHSAVALRVHSAPLDLSANGDLVSAATTGFRGRLSATAPSILSLLGLLGEETGLLAPFANVSLASDAAIGIDPKTQTSIDLQNLKLRADGNDFEGTLALQTGARPMLSGTLATEQLMLAPFLHRLPAPYDAARHWSRAPILGHEPQPLDLDLRISATHMRLAPFTIDDAALAVMTRGDRTEVALAEGKAYGGAAKGRFSVGLGYDGINLRGAGSLAGADASTLTWDAFGRQLAAGTLSGSINLETNGDSPATLMSGLHGWIKGSVVNGEISGLDLGRALREAQRSKPQAVIGALRSGRTSFKTLTLGTRIVDGVVSIDDGDITGADSSVAVEGNVDIGQRTLGFRADATPPDAAASGKPTPKLHFDIDGSFDKPFVRSDFGARPPASAAPGTAPK